MEPNNIKPLKIVTVRMVCKSAAMLVISICAGFFYQLHSGSKEFGTRGATSFRIMAKNGASDGEERRNNVYFPGERLQCIYSCADKNKFILLSVDDEGDVSVYCPQIGDSSIVLEKGNDVPLVNTILLDGHIGPELYAAIFSEEKLSVVAVRAGIGEQLLAGTPIGKIVINVGHDADARTVFIEKRQKAR